MTTAQFIPLNVEKMSEDEMLASSRNFYTKIKARRSVRDFSDKPVPIELINNAILAAGTAPSGANQQPWHFAIVSDDKLKRKIRIAAEEEEKEFYTHRASKEWLDALAHLGTDEHKPFLETAPYLIVVFQKKFTLDSEGNRQKNYYTPESVGIASGILLTALHLSGLATLTHTPSPMRFLNKLLNRPKEERPMMVVVVGYPVKGTKVPLISKLSLEQISSMNGGVR